ncbi:MAG: DNA polymerase III subunit alpha [Chloroflexi bacterium]|nr:DNA polymerase III subunit alpha [Chloroflexota bacterium]
MFTHLHVHTEYSLLDGLSRTQSLVQRARELGMEALAITDHGGMYGVVEFYRACKEAGIKPILGCELYMAPESRHSKRPQDRSPHHLTVLARDNTGYRNLLQVVTKAHLEGFYQRPRADRELLAQHAQGLVVLSGCPSAEVPRLLLDGRRQEAAQVARWYASTFPSSYYVELQRHGNMPELDRLNRELLDLSRELKLPLVATNDLHYVDREDAPLQDVLVCIQTNTNVNDEKRLRMSDDSYYLKSPAEMAELFADVPEAIENTGRIAAECHVELDFATVHLPRYQPPTGEEPEAFLDRLCWEGLERRFGPDQPEARKRLEYELEVIHKTRFANYFLVVWNIAAFVRERGILMGVRGSAASSLALYCLGVTNINPLEYRLVFERFLNVERKEMPDIDMDFQDDRRDEVIQYVAEKYGRDHVAQIISFGTLGAKAAVRDVGRALALPYADVDRVARLIPFKLGITIDEAIQATPELAQVYEEDTILRNLVDTARKLEGVVRHASTHAAGVVISQDPLTEYVPLQRPIRGDDQGTPMTQFSMEPIAQLGLLKMDFLGLANLTILARARDTVARTRDIQLELDRLPLNDRRTFDLLSSGETTGIFQLESGGMRRYIKELRPSSLGDVSAMIALYRPGPMEQITTFIQAKHGQVPVRYPHPALKAILEETYGIIVYQDQVLLILQAFAGYTLGEADIVRKAMGKKIAELMAKERERFIQGAVKRGHAAELATQVFDLIEPFAGYAFNKAHSVSYAVIAYWTAYFKANYPLEYMTSVLNSHRGNMEKVAVAVDECRRLGIRVLPPDVNSSEVEFSMDRAPDGTPAVRFGLGAVKNVGPAAVQPLVGERRAGGPFASLEDFCRRADLKGLNRRTLESLIKVGTLDALGHRSALLASVDRLLSATHKEAELRQSGQSTMFNLFGQSVPTPMGTLELRPAEPVTIREKLAWEKELLGVWLSDNPMSALALRASNQDILSRDQIDAERKGEQVHLAGQLSSVRTGKTREGRAFATGVMELFGGSIEVVAWPDVYEKAQELWQVGNILRVVGKVRVRDDEVSIACDEVTLYPLGEEQPHGEEPAPAAAPVAEAPRAREWSEEKKPAARPSPPPPQKNGAPRKLLINLAETDRPEDDRYLLREVLQVLLEFPGRDGVDLVISSQGKRWRLEMPIITTSYCDELHRRLGEMLGSSTAVRLEGSAA